MLQSYLKATALTQKCTQNHLAPIRLQFPTSNDKHSATVTLLGGREGVGGSLNRQYTWFLGTKWSTPVGKPGSG